MQSCLTEIYHIVVNSDQGCFIVMIKGQDIMWLTDRQTQPFIMKVLLKKESERKPRLIDIPGNLIEWPLVVKTHTQCLTQPLGLKSKTSFTSTNVKLRLRFDIDVHLTFTWRSPDVHLTIIWPSSDLPLTLTRPLPKLQPITDPISGPSFDFTFHVWPWAWQLHHGKKDYYFTALDKVKILIEGLWKGTTPLYIFLTNK